MHLSQAHSDTKGNWSVLTDKKTYPQWPQHYGFKQIIQKKLKDFNKRKPEFLPILSKSNRGNFMQKMHSDTTISTVISSLCNVYCKLHGTNYGPEIYKTIIYAIKNGLMKSNIGQQDLSHLVKDVNRCYVVTLA